MEPDFGGYATKADVVCTDGRVILPDAFKDQDQAVVPLVWQHRRESPENILGHAILENRPDGVYTYGFFNDTPSAKHAKALLEHKDITMLSIWANSVNETARRVTKGIIREVSLVLSGANPGALIDNVIVRHSDGYEEFLDGEAIIYTGLSVTTNPMSHSDDQNEPDKKDELVSDEKTDDVKHEDSTDTAVKDSNTEPSMQDIYDSLTEEQQTVVNFLVGSALQTAEQEFEKKLEEATVQHSLDQTEKKEASMSNVFDAADNGVTISHEDLAGIVADAMKVGSLRDSVERYAIQHGIDNIDVLFPDAQAIDSMPEFLSRRTEWVNKFLSGTRKSPFSRIKTLSADLTFEEARAKGYVTGDLKREEYFSVSKRVTTPTTVYKKQKLDRDDIVDITDFDVVMWLKAEMRLMLDEEIARAGLMGDGRDVSHEDKINEGNIRPIATDHELFATKVYVNLGDANSTAQEVIDQIIRNRRYYKGSGTPTFYTSEGYISEFLLLKDSTGRRIYRDLNELAAELRVSEIVPVEVMEEDTTLVGVMVNPADYVFGATRGGEVNLFDDFDIDYNKYKYLIETRVCGALVKLKAALVVRKVASNLVLVSPAAPSFDLDAGEVTIVNTTGVVYKNGAGTVINAAGSPYSVVVGTPYVVNATPDTGYYFSNSENDSWTFLKRA